MTDRQTERIIEHHAKIYHRFRHLGPEVARAAADEAIKTMSNAEHIIEAVFLRGHTKLFEALAADLTDAGPDATPRVRHMILLGRLYDWACFTGCGWVTIEHGHEHRYMAVRVDGMMLSTKQAFDDGDLALAWVCGVEVDG